MGAIGQSVHRVAAAEEEVGAARIADGPAASFFREFQDGAALPDRNNVIDQFRFQFQLMLIGMSESRIAAHAGNAEHMSGGARLARARSAGGGTLGASRE